jgi:hypothetical protein
MLEGFQRFRVEPEVQRAALAVATAARPAPPWRHWLGMSGPEWRASQAFYCGRLEAQHLQRTPPQFRSRYARLPPLPAALDRLARQAEALLALRGIVLSQWAVLGMVQLTRLEGHGARVKPHTDPRFYGEFLVTVVLSSSRSSLELDAPGQSAGSPLMRAELGAGDAYVLTKASLSKARHQIELLGDGGEDDEHSLSPPDPRFSATLRYYSHDMTATADASGHSWGGNHEEFIEPTPTTVV